MSRTDSSQGFLTDERGRIPFAVIAVILLVSTVAIVGYLEVRETGEIETNERLAMDRADAAVQTELRDATASAAERAAATPLTTPANTSYGGALDENRPFESYLEWLIYDEAGDRFDAVTQRVGDVVVTVSLPAVTTSTTFQEALDRVSVEPERENGEATGMLSVELEGIEITATRAGDTLTSRTETVEVSVPTPVIQQHERTEEFQNRLNANITRSGFSQRFNARIYALGWARGYAQYSGLPVVEVLANRHIEPSANSAVFRTQQDVFGAADPRLEDAVRRGWFCMAIQDGEALYEGYSAGEVDVAAGACEASEWLLGNRHTGEFPDAPDTLDLLGNAPGMDEEETISVNETAYLPLRTLVAGSGDQSLEKAIERAFTIDTTIDAELDANAPTFVHDRPAPDAVAVDAERHYIGLDIEDGGTAFVPETDEEYYRFEDVRVSIQLVEKRLWEWTENGTHRTQTTQAEGTLSVTLTLQIEEENTAPNLYINSVNKQNVSVQYERGPASPVDARTVPTPPDGFENYAGREPDIAEGTVGTVEGSELDEWLERHWQGATTEADLSLPTSSQTTLDVENKDVLVTTIIDDIAELQTEIERLSHTFERAEFVHTGDGTGPFGELIETVETERMAYLERSAAYENVGQQAVYEARYAYFERLLDDLELVHGAHNEAMGSLDEQLSGVDSSLSTALSYLQQGVSAESDEQHPLDSPSLTPEITYEITGSPTYLTGETITTEEVPTVAQEANFSSLAMKNENHLKLPYESIVRGITSRVLEFVGIGRSDAELTLRVAGETLRAGELAEAATEENDGYTESGTLPALNDELHRELGDALDAFTTIFGLEVATQLYTTPDTAGHKGFHSVADRAETAAETELDEYDSSAMAAIELGSGEANAALTDRVVAALQGDEIERPAYARNLSDGDWQAVVASTVPQAIINATGKATVTVSETETVEELDTRVRRALENVSADIVDDRLDEHLGDGEFDLSAYEDWVGGVDKPVRVPAGLPLVPLPGLWKATMNIWDVTADGEYARFEVKANMSAPGRSSTTTYVRENTTVEHEIAGEKRQLGSVDAIGFQGRSVLVVIVPPGGLGVGDRDDVDPECSETYPFVGEFDTARALCE